MIVQFMHPNYCRAFSIVTVNVLIHNGIHASANSVNGTVACLSTANYHNLVPGVWFTWGFNGTINASTLSGYDVLVMPGGDGFGSGYRLDPNINSNDIKNWIATGKGYYGTCAGAYGGTSTVYDYAPNTTSVRYYAWGLAPHVNAIATASDSTALTVSMTSAGQYTLNNSGTLTLRYINGPAMKENTPGGTVFAIYADNITGYPGHIAIVGDTYGSGRTILCGPHPELSPQKPELVARLTAWAGKAIDTQIPVELFDFDAIDEPANN
ncbi:MAG: BPL-N domain-containing protein [bacterium]|nr:BPL-N domain-containing protein [bacterium]